MHQTKIFDFSAKDLNGDNIQFSVYEEKTLLIVNTASKKGRLKKVLKLTYLRELFDGRNFEILAFPCRQFGKLEHKNTPKVYKAYNEEVKCNFPVFSPVEVNGENAISLFKWLKREKPISHNFTKFLCNAEGDLVHRFQRKESWFDIMWRIETVLKPSGMNRALSPSSPPYYDADLIDFEADSSEDSTQESSQRVQHPLKR